jgi:hypothetical protein
MGFALAAALVFSASPVRAGPVGKFVCDRQSGGPMSSFAMTIDFDAKDVDVPSRTGLRPDFDSVEIADTSVQWSFMRGFVKFDRRTGELDWDTTAEYAYLEAIDQPSGEPESDFEGRMRCKADVGRATP